METAISTISVLPQNQQEMLSFQNKLINEIVSGNENPLNALKKLKVIENLVKNVLSDGEVKDLILSEAEKYDNKTFEEFGCEYQIKEVGTKYDYSNCNDSKYFDLKKKESEIKEQIREREKFLKTVPEDVADTETGEILCRPAKYSTTSVVITKSI